jgi:hypothetical protein
MKNLISLNRFLYCDLIEPSKEINSGIIQFKNIILLCIKGLYELQAFIFCDRA